MIPSPLAQNYQQEAIQDLERHPPALIIRSRWPTSWLKQAGTPPAFLNYLEKILAENYERVGGFVLEGQSGHWQEPLPDREVINSSLVLFRRKAPHRRFGERQ